jgi:plasmid stabilization system protein ParE
VDFKIVITEPALVDLEEIIRYSWEHHPASADAFGHSLLDHMEILKNFPYVGRPVANRPFVRQLIHTPIAVYYAAYPDKHLVEILHFWHGSRPSPKTW